MPTSFSGMTGAKIEIAVEKGNKVEAVFSPETTFSMVIYEDRHAWPPRYCVEIVNLVDKSKEGRKIAKFADDARCEVHWVDNSEVRGLLVLTEYVQDAVKVFVKALRVLGANSCEIK